MAELGPRRAQFKKPYGVKGKRIITLTFAECGENQAGMELIGSTATPDQAVSFEELQELQGLLVEKGYTTFLHDFKDAINQGPLGPVAAAFPEADSVPAAGVLVVRGLFKQELVDAAEESLWTDSVPIDTMALMGRGARRGVKNKNARHNNCMTPRAIRPPNIASKEDYADGKGSVLALEDFPEIAKFNRRIQRMLVRDLGVVENNYYFNPGPNNGIGWHGDSERRIATLLRLGEASTMQPLNFQFFWNFKPWGPIFRLPLRHGDVVFFSEFAVGTDWMAAPRRRWTMRHAAGVAHAKPKDANHSTVLVMHPV